MHKMILALAVLLLISPAALADYKTGLAAYKKKQYAVALEEWKAAPQKRSLSAAYGIGLMYHSGRGVKKDMAQAIEWYRKAADKNFDIAQYRLGQIYRIGKDVSRNYREAHKWYLKAAEQGYARAQGRLGHLYRFGRGVPKDLKSALKWYKMAAEQDNAYGQHGVGLMYENGFGTKKDLEEAKFWYGLAAKQGFKRAQNDLTRLEADTFETASAGPSRQVKQSTATPKKKRRSRKRGRLSRQRAKETRGTITTADSSASEFIRSRRSKKKKEKPENHYVPIPDGWQKTDIRVVGFKEPGELKPGQNEEFQLNMERQSYIPPGQSKNNWSELIVIETIRRVIALSPAILVEGLSQIHAEACAEGEEIKSSGKSVDGFLQMEGGHTCARMKSFGEQVTYTKTIEGQKKFYRVQRYWRGRPFSEFSAKVTDQIITNWEPWFDAVVLHGEQAPAPLEDKTALGYHDDLLRLRTPGDGGVSRLLKASTGSGFAVTSDGFVVTNHHVVDNCIDTRTEAFGSFTKLFSDKDLDIAVLKAKVDTPIPYAKFRKAEKLSTGEAVVVAGFPLTGILSGDLNITTGIVSSVSGLNDRSNEFQISAPIQPGNSGGPVMDASGQAIGAAVAKLNSRFLAAKTGSMAENVNFAVRNGAIQSLLKELKVQFSTGDSEQKLSSAEIAKQARQFTYLIECWR